MNLINLSLDQSLLTNSNQSDTLERFKSYAKNLNTFIVLIPNYSNTQAKAYRINPNIQIIPCTGLTKLHSYLKLFFRLVDILKTQPIDIIVSNDPILGALAIFAKKKSKTFAKIQINIFGLYPQNEYWIKQRLQNVLLKKIHELAILGADSIRTDNHHDQKILIQKYNIPAKKISIIPINPSTKAIKYFQTAKPSLKLKRTIAGDNKLILSVGNLYANKDFLNLINAAQILVKKTPNLTFAIVGEGPQKQKLIRTVNRRKLQKHFIFLGALNQKKVSKIFKTADLYVLSSYLEGLPRVLMEAALSKLPIVTTNINGATELINSYESGIIVPPKNPIKLAQAVDFILNNPKQAKEYATKASKNAINILNYKKNNQDLLNSWKVMIDMPHSLNQNKKTVLFVSTDTEFLNKKSAVFKRHQNLAKHFNHIHVIVTTTQTHSLVRTSNLTIHPTPSKNRWFYLFDSLRIAKRIYSYQPIDVVSADNPFINGLIALAIHYRHKTPLNIQIHNDFFGQDFWRNESIQNTIFYQLAKTIIPESDTIRTVSQTITSTLKPKLKHQTQIFTVPVFPKLTKKVSPKKTSSQYDIIFIGRLDSQKDPITFVKVINQLVKTYPKLNAIIIGEGQLKTKIEKYIRTHRLNKNIELAGNIPHSQVIGHLHQSKIFVSTSKYEGTSIALMEAMRLKKAIVVTQVSGVNELITHNQQGLICKVGAFKQIALELDRLLSNNQLQDRLATQAYKRINLFLGQDPLKLWAECLIATSDNSKLVSQMKQSNIEHYNKAGSELEKAISHPSKQIYYRKISDWFANYIKPGETILDIGGGAGVLTQMINQQTPNLNIIGLDISILMCQLRKKIGLKHNLVSDMDQLPFKNNSIDTVIYIASIHHTLNTDLALKEAYRVLKPGGKLLLAEHNSFRYLLQPIQDRAIPAPNDPRECLINHKLMTSQAKHSGFHINHVSIHRQLLVLLEAFQKTPPLKVYKFTSWLDSKLNWIPLYKELGSLMLIAATKPND